MSALPPDQARAMRSAAHRIDHFATPPLPSPLPSALAAQWQDLHATAAQVATLAQLSPEKFAGPLSAFATQITEAQDWQQAQAKQGMDDIEAMMRPGLAALETLHKRGSTTTAPALALWRELYNARRAVMALAGG